MRGKMKSRNIIFIGLSCLLLSACSNSNIKPSKAVKVARDKQEQIKKKKAYIGRNTLADGKYAHGNKATVESTNLAISKNTNVQIPNHFMYFGNRRVFVTKPLDSLGRAQGSHIQVNYHTLPRNKRPQYITVNPTGWHNTKFSVKNTHPVKYNWLYNRGHLVGYQFCGVNSDKRNLITQTTYVNQGSLNGMDDNNPNGQLYYENKLRNWINTHKKDTLDYSVTPGYTGNDLVPRYVVLTYTGYDSKGNEISVNLNADKAKKSGKYYYVLLPNTSPQAKINYKTGYATVYNANGKKAKSVMKWHNESRSYKPFKHYRYKHYNY